MRRRAAALERVAASEHAAAIHEYLHGSVDERMVAGYAVSWWAVEAPESAFEVATELVTDEVWEVREAATFGVRAALIADAEAVMPLMRVWAVAADARQHRAFLVAARQPTSQSGGVVDELLSLMAVPLSDPDPYVRRNISFAVRYLARNQLARLVRQLPIWARSTDEGLQRAAVAALPYLDAPDSGAARRLVLEHLGRSPHARVRRQAAAGSDADATD